MPYQRFLLCCLLTVVCLFTTGCQPGNSSEELVTGDPNTAQVVLLNTDKFPEYMAGIWENESHGWVLRFEPDGRISKIKHTIGRVNLAAGQTAVFPLIDGGQGTMEPGPWYTQYNADTGELAVEITLKDFNYNMSTGNFVGGSSRDIFTGPIAKKGETVWKAQWINMPQFVASTADRQYVDYTLPFDEGMEDQGEIIFEKVVLEAD